MSGFSVDWLDLREPADLRARDASLLAQAKSWLGEDPSSIVVDLGAGTGATLRAFIDSGESGSSTPHWRLMDQDAELLAEARRRFASSHKLETCELDLANVSELPLAGIRLVTASAIFDLVSATFIDSLVTNLQSQCQTEAVGLYVALNYDGTTKWTPAHSLDDPVLSAFNRDQRRNKGLGPALGPKACIYLKQRLITAGFTVSSASSPWILDAVDGTLMTELINGIATAVADDPNLDSESLRDWLDFRLANVQIGKCVIGHRDLLALPEPLDSR